MKKFLIILAVVLTNVFSVVATPVNNVVFNEQLISNDVNKEIIFNDSIYNEANFKSIYRYLNLKEDQTQDFYYIHKDLYNSIRDMANKKENNIQLFQNHINVDLKNSSYILDNNQYRKYLKVLNATFMNKNLMKFYKNTI